MDRSEFRSRTRSLALGVIRLSERVKPSMASQTILRQVLRSATSIDANYRSSGRARSPKEMVSKLGIVEELVRQADEILRMVVASIRTLRARNGMVKESEAGYDANWVVDDPRSEIHDPQ